MSRIWLGVGSNQEKERHIQRAIEDLGGAFGPLLTSSVYESPAVGFAGASFYNLVVGLDSELDPVEMRQQLGLIEDRHGRLRDQKKFSSRTLDLDLLLYGDLILQQDNWQLPHPDILQYAFVLGPLAEVAADLVHPVEGKTYRALWDEFPVAEKKGLRLLAQRDTKI